MNDITAKLQHIIRKLNNATLVCVTKNRSLPEIATVIAAGQQHLAENRLQEALPKIVSLQNHSLTWHFIGRLQANKTRKIAEHFAWVQSVCDLKIAERLNAQRPADMPPLNICIQVNIDKDPDKAGVVISEVDKLAAAIQALPRLKLRGLMTVLQKDTPPVAQLASFERMRQLFDQLNQADYALDTLSMGMSQDYELAIKAGSTMVRLGSVVFE